MVTHLRKNAGQIYLLLVPLLLIIFGFSLGKTNYMFYMPIWIVNVCLMLLASWYLGLNTLKLYNKKHLTYGAFFLIIPFILISMFFGIGPPPTSPQGWVDTAIEQQVRYSMLVMAGIFNSIRFFFFKGTS